MKSFKDYVEDSGIIMWPDIHMALPVYVDEVLVPEIMSKFQVPSSILGKDKCDDDIHLDNERDHYRGIVSRDAQEVIDKLKDDQVHGDPVALGKAAEEIQVNDVPDPTWVDWSERLVRLKDVMLSLSGIDVDQRDGGWWETSTGVKMGQDVIDQIRAASFVPHDGAPTKFQEFILGGIPSMEEKKLNIALEALETLSVLGNGDRMGNSVGNEMAQTALGKISALDQGMIIPEGQAQMVSDFKPGPVIQNNATLARRCPK